MGKSLLKMTIGASCAVKSFLKEDKFALIVKGGLHIMINFIIGMVVGGFLGLIIGGLAMYKK